MRWNVLAWCAVFVLFSYCHPVDLNILFSLFILRSLILFHFICK
jgi:hypothetical protein